MSEDIEENDNASITYETVSDYVDALKKLFVIEDMPINTDKMPKPSFKMVLTAVGEFSYRRPTDGVWVVPIGCLKP